MRKKANKIKNARICVTLPTDMLQNFRFLSEKTGLSISRLVYLRLRKRDPILIVTENVLQEIQGLKELLNEVKCGTFLSYEAFAVLQARVKQFENFVKMDDPDMIIHIRR